MPFVLPNTARRCRDGLQAVPWLSLIGYGLLIMLYGAIASLFLSAAWQPRIMRFLIAASLMLLVAKDVACLALHVARVQAALPPGILAYLRLERAI